MQQALKVVCEWGCGLRVCKEEGEFAYGELLLMGEGAFVYAFAEGVAGGVGLSAAEEGEVLAGSEFELEGAVEFVEHVQVFVCPDAYAEEVAFVDLCGDVVRFCEEVGFDCVEGLGERVVLLVRGRAGVSVRVVFVRGRVVPA